MRPGRRPGCRSLSVVGSDPRRRYVSLSVGMRVGAAHGGGHLFRLFGMEQFVPARGEVSHCGTAGRGTPVPNRSSLAHVAPCRWHKLV